MEEKSFLKKKLAEKIRLIFFQLFPTKNYFFLRNKNVHECIEILKISCGFNKFDEKT